MTKTDLMQMDLSAIENRVMGHLFRSSRSAAEQITMAVDYLASNLPPPDVGAHFRVQTRKQNHVTKKHILRSKIVDGRVWELHATKGWRKRGRVS